MSSKFINKALIVLLPLILAILLSGCKNDWSDAKIKESQNRGAKIIEALEKYKAENNLYPDKLDLLVPKYLAIIEQPIAGNRIWQYSTYENGMSYNLGFKGDTQYDPECWYYGLDKPKWYKGKYYWSLDTK